MMSTDIREPRRHPSQDRAPDGSGQPVVNVRISPLGSNREKQFVLLNMSDWCPLCSNRYGYPHYMLGLYPSPDLEISVPGTGADHTALCRPCGDRVMDLILTWDRVDVDELDDDRALHRAYAEAVDDCSFCGDSADEPVMGVGMLLESESDVGYSESAHTLCKNCTTVFEQFLEQLSGGSER
jgi:hypothetical protein